MKHFSYVIAPGAEIIGFSPKEKEQTPLIIARNPDGTLLAVVANYNDAIKPLSVKIGDKYLNANLKPHSFNTFIIKK